VAIALSLRVRGCGAEDFCERNRQYRLIGSVRNFNLPASPILALPIAFYNHVLDHGDSNVPRSLDVRVPISFAVAFEAILSPNVEVVEGCFRFGLRWRWLTEVVA
jgi:hypothetical protein